MNEKETVYLHKGYEYSPLHPKADNTGMVKMWYAYNKNGVAVEWGTTKKQVEDAARAFGYKVSSHLWEERP